MDLFSVSYESWMSFRRTFENRNSRLSRELTPLVYDLRYWIVHNFVEEFLRLFCGSLKFVEKCIISKKNKSRFFHEFTMKPRVASTTKNQSLEQIIVTNE